MRITVLALVAVTATLSACKSEDYAPSANADPKAIFEAACSGCHVPTSSGKVIALSAERSTAEGVAAKIKSGGITMPKFPNIQGAELESLSAWVLANSERKK